MNIPPERILVRLDGLYGNAAPLFDVLTTRLGVIARHKDYQMLDLPVVQAVLAKPPACTCTHPESHTTRTLFDCPSVPLCATGPTVLLVVATQPATSEPAPVGEQRAETVYELFVSTLPSPAFSAKDALDLYLHRGSFETVLADEDNEQDADRWVSHTAWGQECFQILAQWLWNLRLELGHHLAPAAVRTTEFAPVHTVSPVAPSEPVPSEPAAPVIYGPPHWAKRSFTGGFPGSAFTLQPDGSLRCPADRPLYAQERRPEHDGSLRVLSWLSSSPPEPPVEPDETVFTREQRAHYRLSWSQRLARNTRPADAPRLTVLLHGLPARFFETFGAPAQAAA